MITINFTPTFKNVSAFFNKYNEQFIQSVPSNYSKIENSNDLLEEQRYRNDTAKMLRQSHRDLMERIIKNYAKQVNDAQRLQGEFQYLPAHRTNNGVLAAQLGVSTRTISNLMNRLGPDGAGFFINKRFRGSTHDYEIKLNVSLLSIAKKGIPAVPVSYDDEILDEREYYDQNIKSLTVTKDGRVITTSNYHELPVITRNYHAKNNGNELNDSKIQKTNYHSNGNGKNAITGNNTSNIIAHNTDVKNHQKNDVINTNSENKNNDFTDFEKKEQKKFRNKDNDDILKNDNNKSGEIVKKMTISDLFHLFNGDTPSQKSIENQKKSSVSEQLSDPKKMETPRVAPAPQNDTVTQKIKEKHIIFLHNLMYGTIFSQQAYHAPSQIDYSRNYLIKEFEKLDYKQSNEKFAELKIRIWLAWEQIKWKQARNLPAWIPIPSTYLDPLNFKSGFINTLIRHDKFVEDRRNRKKIAEYNDAIADYFDRWSLLNRALGFYLKDQNYFSYQKAVNYLQKKNPEIVQAFNTMVLKNNQKVDAASIDFSQNNTQISA